MNQLLLIEIQRQKGTPQLIQVAIFSTLTSFLVALSLLYDASHPSLVEPARLEYFAITLSLALGVIISILMLSSFDSDVSSGIFSSYLSYPVFPRSVVLAKWLARYVFIIPAVILPFLLLAPLIPYLSLQDALLVVLFILTLLFMTFVISVASSTMVRYRPIPEVLAIVFILAISVFRDMIPISIPYVYMLNPLLVIQAMLKGSDVPLGDALWGCSSLILYSLILMISLAIMDRIEWGRGDNI